MRLEVGLALAAVVSCAVSLLFYVYQFGTLKLSVDHSAWASFGSYIGGVLSPILAFVSVIGLLITIQQQRSAAALASKLHDGERYLQHAIASLERAYLVISDSDKSPKPVRDRMAWLTCARLLLSARDVAIRITDSEGLRALYDGEEEYWRNRFYEYFQPTSSDAFAPEQDYFEQAGKIAGEVVDERSIRTVYDFMKWPNARVDPIQEVPLYTAEDLERMMAPGMQGIRAYVRSKKRFTRSTDA